MASLLKSEKLSGALGILSLLLLSYPFLQIFNDKVFIVGVPLLFLYVCVVWVLAIFGLYAVSRRLAAPGLSDKQEATSHDQ